MRSLDPGGTAMPRMTALHMLRSIPRVHHFVAHSHTPRNRCVRFVFGVAAASRNTRFQAARYGLTWAGLAPADRISFAGAFPHSITSLASASNVGGMVRPSALAALR